MVAEVLAHELARGERTQHPVSVLLIDVDGFAAINADHGHRVGDEVLGEVAQRVRVALRSYDLVGRFGGDEFLVVLPNCGRANAIEVAQRVRRGVAEAPILLLKAKVDLTLSVGVSTTERGKRTNAADMIAAAELALDDAKRMGRDRVEVAGAVKGDRRDRAEQSTEKL
jgi:diguanylate cyclase (GGDEF)-like protein